MTLYRKEYVIEVEKQSALDTEASGTPKVGTLVSTDLSSVKFSTIENPTVLKSSGKLKQIKGLSHPEIGVPLEVIAEGLESTYGDGDTAVETYQDLLLASVFQSDPDLTIGSLISGTPSTTGIEEATSDAHSLSTINSKTACGMVVVEGSTKNYMRPYTYASDTLSLKCALDSAPSAGDVLYGCSTLQFNEGPWSTIPYPITLRFLGQDDLQNKKLIGAVSTLAVPEGSPNDLGKLQFNFQAASMDRNFSDSANFPTVPQARILADGELKLGIFGQTDMTNICGKISFKLRDKFIAKECRNNSAGIDNWLPSKNIGQIELTIPADVLPSDLTGCSAASWTALWEESSTTYFHILETQGQGISGKMLGFYFPKLIMNQPDEADLNEFGAIKLTFEFASNSEFAHAIVGRG